MMNNSLEDLGKQSSFQHMFSYFTSLDSDDKGTDEGTSIKNYDIDNR